MIDEKSVTSGRDSYSICIVLRHPERNAGSISLALSLTPDAKLTKAKGNWLYASLQTGDDSSDYGAALAKVSQFLNANANYWPDFMRSGGEAEIVLNHTIALTEESGDKCLELQLAHSFLQQLSAIGFALRVQGWQGQKEGF
jgi:hypothetical protein